MRLFRDNDEAIVTLIRDMAAVESARKLDRYADYYSLLDWKMPTLLGQDGAGLSPDELQGLALQVARFFNFPDDALSTAKDIKISDWVATIQALVQRIPQKFTFFAISEEGIFKEITHDYSLLATQARVLMKHFNKLQEVTQEQVAQNGSSTKIFCALPVYHLVGFIVGPFISTIKNSRFCDLRVMSQQSIMELCAPADIVIASPTMWRYYMKNDIKFDKDILAVVYGEPIGVDFYKRMREHGLGRLCELYGSMQTGIVGYRLNAEDSFTLYPPFARKGRHLVFHSRRGVETRMQASDFFRWTSARGFTVRGRRDGAIQIGARNIYPRKIAKVFLEHPDIDDCSVRVEERDDGQRKLVVEMKVDRSVVDDDFAKSVERWGRRHLMPSERPAIYLYCYAPLARSGAAKQE